MSKANPSKTPVPPLRRALQWIAGLIIALLVVNFCYQVWARYYHNKQYLTSVKSCSVLVNACTVLMKNNTAATLSISPRPFKPGQQIETSVTLKNLTAEHVYLLVFPAGKPDPRLKPITLSQNEPNQYSAYLTAPIAVSEDSKWIIMLIIQTKEENYAVPFRFELQ